MASERDKARRWQFSLRDLLALTFLVILPIAGFMLAEQLDSPNTSPMLFFASVVMTGGVVGGVVGWTCVGTRKGFWLGYVIGGPIVLIGVFAFLFFIMLALSGLPA